MAGVNTELCSNRRLNQERQGVFPAGPPLRHGECLRRGRSGGKRVSIAGEKNTAAVMEYHPFNYRKILMISLRKPINPQKNTA